MLDNWYKPTEEGEEIKRMPWLHPAVIAYLESLLFPNMRILEHGCGGGTLWFADRVSFVRSAEHNADWARTVNNQPGTDNVKIKYGGKPLDFGKNFDLVLIDGEPIEDRTAWAFAAPRLVKPGGIIVFDNFNRPEFSHAVEYIRKQASAFITFEVNPPGCKHLVTEFYRMPGGKTRLI